MSARRRWGHRTPCSLHPRARETVIKLVNAGLDKPLVLPGGQDENVRELLQGVLDLGNALVYTLQFGPHSVIGACTGQNKAGHGKYVSVIDRSNAKGHRVRSRTPRSLLFAEIAGARM